MPSFYRVALATGFGFGVLGAAVKVLTKKAHSRKRENRLLSKSRAGIFIDASPPESNVAANDRDSSIRAIHPIPTPLEVISTEVEIPSQSSVEVPSPSSVYLLSPVPSLEVVSLEQTIQRLEEDRGTPTETSLSAVFAIIKRNISDEDVVAKAFKAVYRLVARRQHLVVEINVRVVVDAMQRHPSSECIIKRGCDVLGYASCDKVYDSGVLPLLVEGMRLHQLVEKVEHAILVLLLALTEKDTGLADLDEAGGIPLVLDIMRQFPYSSRVQELGTVLLGRMARCEGSRVRVVDAGGVAIIRDLVHKHWVHKNQVNPMLGFEALCRLAEDRRSRAKVAEEGGIELVLRSMEFSEDMVAVGIHILFKIAFDVMHRDSLIKHIDVIVGYLRQCWKSQQTQHIGLRLILRLLPDISDHLIKSLDWDSVYVEGEYQGRSYNVWQIMRHHGSSEDIQEIGARILLAISQNMRIHLFKEKRPYFDILAQGFVPKEAIVNMLGGVAGNCSEHYLEPILVHLKRHAAEQDLQVQGFAVLDALGSWKSMPKVQLTCVVRIIFTGMTIHLSSEMLQRRGLSVLRSVASWDTSVFGTESVRKELLRITLIAMRRHESVGAEGCRLLKTLVDKAATVWAALIVSEGALGVIMDVVRKPTSEVLDSVLGILYHIPGHESLKSEAAGIALHWAPQNLKNMRTPDSKPWSWRAGDILGLVNPIPPSVIHSFVCVLGHGQTAKPILLFALNVDIGDIRRNAKALRDAGATAVLLNIIEHSSSKKAHRRALKFLAALSFQDASCSETVLNLVIREMRSHPFVPHIQYDGCSALGLLAQDVGFRPAVIANGGLGAVLSALKKPPCFEFWYRGVFGALGPMVRHSDAIAVHVFERGIVPLVLKKLAELVSPKWYLSTLQWIVPSSRLFNLLTDLCKRVDLCSMQIITEGGIEEILKFMEKCLNFSEDLDLDLDLDKSPPFKWWWLPRTLLCRSLYNALELLTELAKQEAEYSCTKIVQSGGVGIVVSAMQEFLVISRIQLHGCQVLLALATDFLPRVVKGGGLDAVLRAMRSHPSSHDIQNAGVKFLSLLSGHSSGLALRTKVTRKGAVKAILSIMRADFPDWETQLEGLNLLLWLSGDETLVRRIAEDGAVGVVLETLKHHSSSESKRWQIFKVMTQIVRDREVCCKMIRDALRSFKCQTQCPSVECVRKWMKMFGSNEAHES